MLFDVEHKCRYFSKFRKITTHMKKGTTYVIYNFSKIVTGLNIFEKKLEKNRATKISDN